MKFKHYEGVLEPTDWVKEPQAPHRPNTAICRDLGSGAIVRCSPFANWTRESATGTDAPLDTDIERILGIRKTEIARLRKMGVRVVGYTDMITADESDEKYFLSVSDRVEPAEKGAPIGVKDTLLASLIDYVAYAYLHARPLMTDIFKWDQFVFGRVRASQNNQMWLVDIDPLCPDPRLMPPVWARIYAGPTVNARSNAMTDVAINRIRGMIASVGVPHTNSGTEGEAPLHADLAITRHGLVNTRRALRDYYYTRAFHENKVKGANVWTRSIQSLPHAA